MTMRTILQRHGRRHMALLRTIFPALLLTGPALQAQRIEFSVWQGDKQVGSIAALCQHPGPNATYVVSSRSELAMVKKTVRTVLAAAYRGGRPISCFSSLRVNDNLRDSSWMQSGTDGYVYPKERFAVQGIPAWCSARMYFEEPVGQREVFVESILRNRPLTYLGNGTYHLDLPERKANIYRYRDGLLQEVQIERPWINLVFRRK